MKTLLTIASICLLSFFANAMESSVGFQNGNNIGIIELHGRVQVSCAGHPSLVTYYCDGYIAEPGSHDYFTTSEPVDADKVSLTALHKDGSTRTKNSKFKETSSTSRFNLVISTLTQRPLLESGTNKISYELTKSKQVVQSGSFDVTVGLSEVRQCKYRVMNGVASYCTDKIAACDHYFDLERNCKY